MASECCGQNIPAASGPGARAVGVSKVYGRDVSPDVAGDLVVRDEYLGWVAEKRPEE